jgi:hypothetical protein
LIEWNATQEGLHWARFEDRALCSSRDPRKEARVWCDGLSFLANFHEATVVGIGAGHHLLEMKNRWPHLKVRAFDSKEGLQSGNLPESVREFFAQLGDRFELLVGAEAESRLLDRAPQGPVLKFHSACFRIEDDWHRRLLGQSPESFLAWIESLQMSSLEPTLHGLPVHLAVNVKTLRSDGQPTRETKILEILKELVQ